MIIDNHVHVGWFTDGYHTPKEIWDSMVAAGVDGMAVSSTSTCAELYKDVVRELRELKRLGGERVRPLLWLSPKMMKSKYPLPYMLHSNVNWQGIKIHSKAHPEWVHNHKLLNKALNVARSLNVPVMFHTGEDACCHAGLFQSIAMGNVDLTFVLAHARPVDETIDTLGKCVNVYVDLAFVSREDIGQLYRAGFKERMLFGTDVPINKIYYGQLTTTDYISRHVQAVRDVCGKDAEEILGRTVYDR